MPVDVWTILRAWFSRKLEANMRGYAAGGNPQLWLHAQPHRSTVGIDLSGRFAGADGCTGKSDIRL
jgi:hypothetical protein